MLKKELITINGGAIWISTEGLWKLCEKGGWNGYEPGYKKAGLLGSQIGSFGEYIWANWSLLEQGETRLKKKGKWGEHGVKKGAWRIRYKGNTKKKG